MDVGVASAIELNGYNKTRTEHPEGSAFKSTRPSGSDNLAFPEKNTGTPVLLETAADRPRVEIAHREDLSVF